MEHKDFDYTNSRGEKEHISFPPEDIDEQVQEQRKKEFELAEKLLQGPEPDTTEEGKEKKGEELVEKPPEKEVPFPWQKAA
ncbi:MAG: hypothetical protein V1696_00930 [Candidatus Jorgensenbacteria bacterium]